MLITTGRRQLFFSSAIVFVAVTMGFAWQTKAAILIPTNFGGGADAELREDPDNHMRPATPATDPSWAQPGAPRGRNRGGLVGTVPPTGTGDLDVSNAGGQELATRVLDRTSNPSNDRTSAAYLKFDISGLTQSDLNNNPNVALKLTVRNTNLNWSRIYALNQYYGSTPANDTNPEWVAFRNDLANNWTRVKFNLYGVRPEPLGAADPRRFGNVDPTLSIPNYNWIENPTGATGDPVPELGTDTNNATDPITNDQTTWNATTSPVIGPNGPITWYNAPGITPDSRTTPAQDAGKFNWNSDMELLGQFTLPDPPGAAPPIPDGGARLPVGAPVYFGDNDGFLRALIQRAKDNGRTTITLAVAVAIDGRQNETGETVQKTNTSMLNFNYLFNPKEKTTLENDNNWDPDGAGPLTPSGSPFSCDGSTGAGLTNCPGRTLGDNSAAHFRRR